MSTPVSIGSYVRLVRENRNFRLLWLAQIVSEIGDWLYSIAIYALLLSLTGKAQSVAIAVVLQVLPQVLVSPAAGVLNDRLSRRRVMIFADLVRAVVVLAMLFAVHAEAVWAIYVLLFLETMMWGLFEPGRGAVIPSITQGSQVLVANALSSTTWSFNLAVGASLGGLAATYFGRDVVFLANSVTFLASAMFLMRMRFVESHLRSVAPMSWQDMVDFSPVVEGLRYFRGDRCLLATLLAKCGLGLMGASWVVLPVYGERIFPVRGVSITAEQSVMLGMSVLVGARGVGALIGPLVSGRIAGFEESGCGGGFWLASPRRPWGTLRWGSRRLCRWRAWR